MSAMVDNCIQIKMKNREKNKGLDFFGNIVLVWILIYGSIVFAGLPLFMKYPHALITLLVGMIKITGVCLICVVCIGIVVVLFQTIEEKREQKMFKTTEKKS